jgi:hypothetical protein
MKPQYLHSIKQSIETIRNSYYKQIYVYDYKYGDSVKVYAEAECIPYINVNLELSEKLLVIPGMKRKYYVTEFLQEIIIAKEEEIVCLDFLELLFSPELAINPFQLIRDISKNKVLILSWRGNIEGNVLIHAEPGHPEYTKEIVTEGLIIQ